LVEEIRAATLENLFEAQRLSFILDEEGIPHTIKSFHDAAYDGLFQSHLGWGTVLSLPEHEARIVRFLEMIRQDPESEPEDNG
jgi:hypothetical protein